MNEPKEFDFGIFPQLHRANQPALDCQLEGHCAGPTVRDMVRCV